MIEINANIDGDFRIQIRLVFSLFVVAVVVQLYETKPLHLVMVMFVLILR